MIDSQGGEEMNKQRKVLITITYNEMGIIIDTNAEEVAQPEPIWGLPVSADRPLADVEIVSRLRDIQKQIPGGSYAIDRVIEIIEAVAERRTDD